MKKLIIIIVFVFCGILHVNSQQVTRQEAITAAINTIKYCGKQDVSETELSVFTKQKGDTVLVYEVVFPTGEMVLLSGNKSCLPVLGYRLPGKTVASESVLSHFDDIPGGLRDMIEEYIEQIEECFVNGTNIGYHAEWQELQYYLPERNNRTVVVSPLLTSIWGQDRANYGLDYNAYNYYVQEPSVCSNGHNCPAGCVAVAMSQIMYYWKYPVYSPNIIEQYDWCNMPDLLNANSNNYVKERNAVARLIRDCGIAVDMSYCSNDLCQSSASSFDVPEALEQFGYSHATIKRKKWHSNNWLTMLKNELNLGRPVYYKGRDELLGGHAFVCDGYDSEDRFHFNWGWNGLYNDMWCTVNQLNPSGYAFTSDQAAIFDFYPDNTQDYCDFELPLQLYYNLYYNLLGNEAPAPYENVPKMAAYLISVENSSQYPSSWRTIPLGAVSEYVAHKEIHLMDGFRAEEGCDFYAYIVPCESCEDERSEKGPSLSKDKMDDVDALSCSQSSQSTQEISSSSSMTIYPNPVTGSFNIRLDNPEETVQFVEVFNLLGSRAVIKEVNSQADIDVVALYKGMYLVRVRCGSGNVYFGKFVKE
ncbi:MAG: C10 family peptidase [Bacteroidales bacterium]|nr:C10 family peptidase [Bacteroidales bacterium]